MTRRTPLKAVTLPASGTDNRDAPGNKAILPAGQRHGPSSDHGAAHPVRRFPAAPLREPGLAAGSIGRLRRLGAVPRTGTRGGHAKGEGPAAAFADC